MIYDTLAALVAYRGLSASMDVAIQYLLSHDLNALPLGRTEIQGEDVYLLVSDVTYKPAEEGAFEVHRQYADIQLSLTGGEKIGYLPLTAIASWGGYEPDCQLAQENPEGLELPMEKGRFAVFFPQDAHRPGVGQGKGRKIVVKVRL